MVAEDWTFTEVLNTMEALLEYKFNDQSYLWEAVHSPIRATRFNSRKISGGNRGLAFVGVGAIRAAAGTKTYREGFSLTGMNALLSLVDSDAYWEDNGSRLEFGDFVTVLAESNAISSDVMARTMRAILGAVMVDSGGNVSLVERSMDSLGCFQSWQFCCSFACRKYGRHSSFTTPTPDATATIARTTDAPKTDPDALALNAEESAAPTSDAPGSDAQPEKKFAACDPAAAQ